MPGGTIKRVLRSALRRIGISPRFEQRQLLGYDVWTRPGSFRDNPDYDDAWFLRCCLDAEHVFDVGANVGLSSLVARRVAQVPRVTLIEPNPEALLVAVEHLLRNDCLDGVRLVAKLAHDSVGRKVRLWATGPGAASSIFRSHARTASRKGRSVEVETTTLDHLAKQGSAPDFIKIDVEGAEAAVLNGTRGPALERQPRLLVEMHSNPELKMVDNAARVLVWCQETGYRAWYLSRGVELCDPQQIAGRGRCHLLLQRASCLAPEDLLKIPQGAVLEAGLAAVGV